MKDREDYAPRPPRRQWRTVALAGLVLAACSTTVALLGLWPGSRTIALTAGEAWDVIQDLDQPANRKQLAIVQLFRIAEAGGDESSAAKHMLEQLAKRSDACGQHARRHLNKLTK